MIQMNDIMAPNKNLIKFEIVSGDGSKFNICECNSSRYKYKAGF